MWEKVTKEPLDDTYRLKVPGGYLYRYSKGAYNSTAMVFVPCMREYNESEQTT